MHARIVTGMQNIEGLNNNGECNILIQMKQKLLELTMEMAKSSHYYFMYFVTKLNNNHQIAVICPNNSFPF